MMPIESLGKLSYQQIELLAPSYFLYRLRWPGFRRDVKQLLRLDNHHSYPPHHCSHRRPSSCTMDLSSVRQLAWQYQSLEHLGQR